MTFHLKKIDLKRPYIDQVTACVKLPIFHCIILFLQHTPLILISLTLKLYIPILFCFIIVYVLLCILLLSNIRPTSTR